MGNWLRQFTQTTLAPLVQLNHDLVIDAVTHLALPRLTIDVDGTVVRTGATVGWAFRGFNPHHRKDPSYYLFALMAFLFGGTALAGAQSVEKPKVMVVIDEKVAGVFGTTGWETVGQAESTLAQRLRAAGFQVVDPQTVRRNIARDKALRLLDGDEQAAVLAALQFGAQIVITGQAISKNAGGKLLGTNMQTLQATVQARTASSDDGHVIASRSAQGSQAHIDEVQGGVLAIEKASREVADGLVADLQMARSAAAPREVTLVIGGLVSYRHLMAIRQFLESGLPGVKGVQVQQFAQGTAELGVQFASKSAAVADDLASRKFTGFRLDPISVTHNRIDLQAVLENRTAMKHQGDRGGDES
jgi:hypothetical protein